MSEIQFPILIVGIFSIVSSYFLTYLVHNLTKGKKIIIKKFSERRLSDKDIPPFGGLSMSITFLLATRLLGEASQEIRIISIGCVAIALVGLFDDLFNLDWWKKLLFQIVCILIPIFNSTIVLNIEENLKIDRSNIINNLTTLLWVLLIVNSVNFIDNMDGLAASISMLIAIELSILAFFLNQNNLADVAGILGFTIFGFLLMNFPPAKIYMGDSGSMFLGYCLAFLSVIFIWNPSNSDFWRISIQPVLLFFTIPIFDLGIVVISRLSKGKSPIQGGVDHISHRLMNLGFTEKKVILAICLLNIYTVIMIFFMVTMDQLGAGAVLITFVLSFIGLGLKLLKVETYD